jgi:S1-C subfamily serine protease
MRTPVLALIALTVSVLSGYLGGLVSNADRPTSETTPAATNTSDNDPPQQPFMDSGQRFDIPTVYNTTAATVVQIVAETGETLGTGTGVIVSRDGEIVTNAHVIGDGAEVRIRLYGTVETVTATVLGVDADRDIALLRVDTTNLQPATFATTPVYIGQDVIAVGYALGIAGDATVTSGIISATNRSVGTLAGLIQTDASISPGNSGGPVLDSNGDVIGIATAKASPDIGADNIGFVIPSDQVLSVIDTIRSGQPRARAVLGVTTTDPEPGNLGATITEIAPDSAAFAAKLKPGDIIVSVNGATITGPADLRLRIASRNPGDTIEIVYRRNSETRTATVTLLE